MLLKRLEIFGFKSFADKTVLEFEEGITAIVGPNGCGKSNIVDAIKWVLGEQSARELRGSSMEDVIFNGTSFRERVNLAEVSLVISNEDGRLPIEFTEVTITRRLFRSGESEYLINKTPVRLKDIQELIAGTGIGTKAYSLMEQGKIDLILSSKPEERRFIFEEASGITRFKTKKKEAIRKLENTESNLVRVSDIITELRRQISSLERLARKAERYKVLYEELKMKEARLAGAEIKKAKDARDNYSRLGEGLKNELYALERQLQAEEEATRKLREDIARLSEQLGEDEAKVHELRANLNMCRQRIEWNQRNIEELDERLNSLEIEIQEVEKQYKDIEDRITSARNEHGAFEIEEDNLTREIQKIETELKKLEQLEDSYQKEIKNDKDQILTLNYQLTQKKNLVLELEGELKSLTTRAQRLREEKEDLLQKIKDSQERVISIQNELEKKIRQRENLKEDISKLNLREEELSFQLDSVTERINHLTKEIAGVESRLSSWKEVLSQGLGYSHALLIVEKEFSHPGILGNISKLLSAQPDKVNIVELGLREYFNSLVVKDAQTAEKVLEFLKKRGLSELRILILENLKPTQPQELEDAHPLSHLMELASGAERLKALGDDVYYVADFNKARELSRRYPEYKFICSENIRFEEGSIMVGPDPEKDLGYLDREGKIRRLEEKLTRLQTELGGLEEERQKIKEEFEKIQSERKNKEEKLREMEFEIAGLNKTLETEEENKNSLLSDLEVVEFDLREAHEGKEKLHHRRSNLVSEIADLEAGLSEIEARIRTREQDLEKVRNSRYKLDISRTELVTKLETLNERRSKFQEWMSSLNNEKENILLTLEKRKSEYNECVKRKKDLSDEIKAKEKEIVELNNQISREEQGIGDKKQEYEKKRVEFDEAENNLMALRNSYSEKKDKLHSLELQLSNYQHEINSILERMLQRYGISEIKEESISPQEEEQLRREVEELKQRLQRMGEVNIVAIEEHKRLQERLNFLENQQKDLIEAKESLLSAIRKINRTTREMFSQTFQEIRTAFKEIFPRLFGGGDADLILEQGDCLEAGIEILARPPGKKLQSVNLLSGGEKALTALSLLFAIFKVKPSPFCILDEVDAPLDESNIDRFRKLLEEFAVNSQFLVITHNKRTISTADVIYGITMENTGVSKIVSVKFQKEEVKS
jgi:chromosome segregation protein